MSTPLRHHKFGRLMTLIALTGAGLMVGVGSASAHVTVSPNTATAGSYTVLTFRVPNESATASTDQLTVNFPMDHPFASVLVEKEPGWTATTTTAKLATPISDDDNAMITEAVSSITWKADATGKIALGQFAEFNVEVGPVPAVASLSFPVAQNYDDGSIVNWNEHTPASGVEPENPAPTLTIAAAGSPTQPSAPTSAQTAPSGASVAPAATVTTAAPAATSDNAARTLGVVAIVIAALALLVGALGLRKRSGTRP